MKYALLAAWAKELAAFEAPLQELFLGSNLLTLQLKGQKCLKIVLNNKDSFIYLEAKCTSSALDTPLWPFLKGAHLRLLGLDEGDRIMRFELSKRDIYGDIAHYLLICELMPPKPNVILCKAEDLRVIDAIHKYSLSENPMRMVLANHPYFPPETRFSPESTPESAVPLLEGRRPATFNEYLALFHKEVLKKTDTEDRQKRQLKRLLSEEKKLQKRLKSQQQDLLGAQQMDYYQACAEAIKPNMHRLKKGDSELKTTNYLSENLEEIRVSLQPDKSPQENLAYYIKKYRKAKSGLKIIQLNIRRTEAEIESLQKLLERSRQGEILDLEDGGELGPIKGKTQQQNKLLNFRIDEDWHIYIGRKAKENDYICTRLGKPQDWWFHSRIYRGAHVLLRNYKKREPGPNLIEICSSLAAWYSQARFSVNVPVDYTQIRYVRKPKGSAAGFVTYSNYRTHFATPQDLRSIRAKFDSTD